VTRTLLGGGGANGLLNFPPLLGRNPGMGGRGLVDKGEPGQGPQQTHSSCQVEDTGPAGNGDQVATDGHGYCSSKGRSYRINNKYILILEN